MKGELDCFHHVLRRKLRILTSDQSWTAARPRLCVDLVQGQVEDWQATAGETAAAMMVVRAEDVCFLQRRVSIATTG